MSDSVSCGDCSSWGRSRDEQGKMLWQKTADTKKCYPALGSGQGYPTYDSCLSGKTPTVPNKPRNITCSGIDNKVKCGTCQACLESYSSSSCCGPQPYSNLSQTWATQKKYDL